MPARLTGLCLLSLLCPMVAAAQPATRATITIDASKRHQTIDGFGTCLISWVPRFERLYSTPEFQKIYADELGCSMMRINLWGPVMPKPVEDWRQIRYQDFVLTGEGHRTRLFIAAGKGFKRVNPQMRFIGTAWSPPAWMKQNNAIVDTKSGAIGGDSYTRDGRTFDNRVKPEYFPHFAKWLVEMAKLHQAEGVPLYAISPGNEVMFTQTFESCVWSAEDLATVVALLGEQLEAEGLGDVKIFGPETMTSHNWSPDLANELYIKKLTAHPDAWRHFDVWATHGYTDGFTTDKSKDSTAIYWNMIKDTGKPFWITEGGTGAHDWPAALHEIGAMIHNALVGGNASAFVPWQITEGKKSEHGLMVMDEFTGKTRAAQHYFKYIRPGAVRVDATPSDGPPVAASAYVHDAEKTLTIVLTNPTTAEQTVTINLNGDGAAGVRDVKAFRTSAREQFEEVDQAKVKDGKLELTLPAESMVTLRGSTGARS